MQVHACMCAHTCVCQGRCSAESGGDATQGVWRSGVLGDLGVSFIRTTCWLFQALGSVSCLARTNLAEERDGGE